MKTNKKDFKSGFTLLELLVVVLIIGILASIALPQYEMAVTKAKVASILPLMRRWKDALAEYKLQHGSYEDMEDTSVLGVSWPSDWKKGNTTSPCGEDSWCKNENWNCTINEFSDGSVVCDYNLSPNEMFKIIMLQADSFAEMYCYDDNAKNALNKTICSPYSDRAEKICKSMGKFVCEADYPIYQIGG